MTSFPHLPSGQGKREGSIIQGASALYLLQIITIPASAVDHHGPLPYEGISSHLVAEFGFFLLKKTSSHLVADIWFLLKKKLHQQRFGIRFLSKCFYSQETPTNYTWLVSIHFENLLYSCSLFVLRVLSTRSGVPPLSAHKCSSPAKAASKSRGPRPCFLARFGF